MALPADEIKTQVGQALPAGSGNLQSLDVRAAMAIIIDNMVTQYDAAAPRIEVTESRETEPTDEGAVLWTQTPGIVLTVAENTLTDGAQIELRTRGSGTMEVVAGDGVTLSVGVAGSTMATLETRLLQHYEDNAFDLFGGALPGEPPAPPPPTLVSASAIFYDVEIGP